MSTIINVSTTTNGVPAKILWDDQAFVVTRKPRPWVDRNAWWLAASRAPSGHSAGLLERLVYRLQISDEAGRTKTVDVSMNASGWVVDELLGQ